MTSDGSSCKLDLTLTPVDLREIKEYRSSRQVSPTRQTEEAEPKQRKGDY